MQATDNDRETLAQLKRLTVEKGYPPSVRELGAALGLSSTSPVHRRLDRLVWLGWVTRVRNQPRTLRITDDQT
jgi:repressor LexA